MTEEIHVPVHIVQFQAFKHLNGQVFVMVLDDDGKLWQRFYTEGKWERVEAPTMVDAVILNASEIE